MTTVEHSAIPDAYIHEPKDISTAAVDTVYKSNGSSSGDWEATGNLPTGWQFIDTTEVALSTTVFDFTWAINKYQTIQIFYELQPVEGANGLNFQLSHSAQSIFSNVSGDNLEKINVNSNTSTLWTYADTALHWKLDSDDIGQRLCYGRIILDGINDPNIGAFVEHQGIYQDDSTGDEEFGFSQGLIGGSFKGKIDGVRFDTSVHVTDRFTASGVNASRLCVYGILL